MTLTLWSDPDSSNALKVRFLLAELDLPYEIHPVSMARPRPQEYLDVNPVGGIPTLQDDDFTLAESHAILRYLATRERRADLYPDDARERATVDEFLERFNTGLRTALFRVEAVALGWALADGFDPSRGDAARAAEVAAEVAGQIDLLERVVGDGGFTVLGRFTIADCAIAPVLHRMGPCGIDLDARPRLRALREGLLTRPAWAAAGPAL
jgi:glutathione S-transferase